MANYQLSKFIESFSIISKLEPSGRTTLKCGPSDTFTWYFQFCFILVFQFCFRSKNFWRWDDFSRTISVRFNKTESPCWMFNFEKTLVSSVFVLFLCRPKTICFFTIWPSEFLIKSDQKEKISHQEKKWSFLQFLDRVKTLLTLVVKLTN